MKDIVEDTWKDDELVFADFIGNVPKENAELIKQAAKNTKFLVYTSNNATDRFNHPLPSDVAVYTYSKVNHGPFWREYHRLVDERLNIKAEN